MPTKAKVTRTAQTNTRADAILTMFDEISTDVLKSVTAKIDRRVAAKVADLEARVEAARPIQLYVGDKAVSAPTNKLHHKHFQLLLQTLATNQPAMLVGPAGTGKSFAAQSAAELLDTPFYAMSVGAQTSKSDLIGYMDANGNYVSTTFRTAYESGGLFLLDEIDAGNSNVLIQLNAALANGYMSFPDGMVPKHPDFRLIATANTYGLGANRVYVGRNQLDAATLDRFVVITWPIDDAVELSMAIGERGGDWYHIVLLVRDYVQQNDLRLVVSPRATSRGSTMLASGVHFNEVLHSCLLSQFTGTHLEQMHAECHGLWQTLTNQLTESKIVDAEAWITEVRQMSLGSAYTFCFGDVPLPTLSEDMRIKAESVFQSADDWTKLKFLCLTQADEINWLDSRWQLRGAIFHNIKDSGWDFREYLFEDLSHADFTFVPAGLKMNPNNASSVSVSPETAEPLERDKS